jgi:hypothetical protein
MDSLYSNTITNAVTILKKLQEMSTECSVVFIRIGAAPVPEKEQYEYDDLGLVKVDTDDCPTPIDFIPLTI